MTRSPELELAVTAALAAGEIIRAAFRQPTEILAKSHLDFATGTDLVAERAILDVLGSGSEWPVLGEEFGWSADVGGKDRVWYVDPLCGTANFAASVPIFCVNIALVERGIPVLGVVYDPIHDETFCGDFARSFIIDSNHTEQKLSQDDVLKTNLVDLKPAQLGAGKPASNILAVVDAPVFQANYRLVRFASTLALAWVAFGRLAAYIDDGKNDDVHFAAGVALCRASNRPITHLDGRPWSTGGGGVIAAANLAIHKDMVGLCSQIL
jgi:myo-inositol-1(or 4)-monophosphatase